MWITIKAVEKLQQRIAAANACGVRLDLVQFGCSGYKYDLKFVNEKPTLNDVVYKKILYVNQKHKQAHVVSLFFLKNLSVPLDIWSLVLFLFFLWSKSSTRHKN